MNLESIPKIGNKTIAELNNLNIYTITDLVNYYPYKYNIYNPSNINNCIEFS